MNFIEFYPESHAFDRKSSEIFQNVDFVRFSGFLDVICITLKQICWKIEFKVGNCILSHRMLKVRVTQFNRFLVHCIIFYPAANTCSRIFFFHLPSILVFLDKSEEIFGQQSLQAILLSKYCLSFPQILEYRNQIDLMT